MKSKQYPKNCFVLGEEHRPVIVITNDVEWHRTEDPFLRPKDRGQRTMTSEFLLSYSRLNFASLSPEK